MSWLRTKAGRSPRRFYLTAVALLLAGLLALVVGTTFWTYRHVREQVEQELETRLLSIGGTIAQTVSSQPLLAAAAADSSDSARVLAPLGRDLRRIAEESRLGRIEILDTKRRTLAGSAPDVPFGTRDPLLGAQPELAAALAGIPAATPTYEAEGVPEVFFKTGFVPIEDSSGTIHGVVAVEGGSGFFAILSSLRRIWLVTGIGSAMIAVVLAILLIGVLRALARYEEGLRGATALASAGQLAAAVAHEIRNPLQVLQSRAERVQEELQAGTDRAEIQRLLDTIPSEVRRLDRILTNYLSLARVREESASSGVARVVEETVELLEKEMARSRIRIAVDPGPAGLRARIGPGPLRQALLNLCLNAREAMPEGGELSIGIERRDGWVRLAVRDTGVGIDRAVRDRVFEPFFTTRRSGSGLGLAVVDSILRRNGGRIEVQSEPGKGSVFTLWLPVDEKGDDEGDAGEARIVPDPAR